MKCTPSTYAVITGNGAITYGFRCRVHQIETRRYSSRELRDQRLGEHQQEHKKS